MATLPAGTVTFLFTDIEGSTELIQRLGDRRYAEVLDEHRRMLRDAFAEGRGRRLTPRETPSWWRSPEPGMHWGQRWRRNALFRSMLGLTAHRCGCAWACIAASLSAKPGDMSV